MAVRSRSFLLWASALAVALTFLTIDNAKRISLVRRVSEPVSLDRPGPRPDPLSPTGYELEQHRLVMPWGNADAYNWIMQTERMLAGDGLRIRETRVDNAPDGRPVHWSGSVRWWLASVAWLYQRFHSDSSLPLAVEHVAPWALGLALALFMLVLTPLLARRLGTAAAALFALGCVAIYGFYQLSTVLDHHSFAAMSCFAAVIFLAAGGGGWVRADDAGTRVGQTISWHLPPIIARRWFIASAIAAAAGLWISAATMAPVMLGIGIGALLANGLLSRAQPVSGSQLKPELWRVWGITGFVACLCFYALEYFPAHLGMRLEVNHPLYGLAWLGAGDLIYRVAQRTKLQVAWTWLLLDATAIALLPIVILMAKDNTFSLADPFLWALHTNYITEFKNLGALLARLEPAEMLPIAQPALLVVVPALMWPTTLTGPGRTIWRVVIAALLLSAFVLLHGMLFYSWQSVLRSIGMLPDDPAVALQLITVFAFVTDAAVLTLLRLIARKTPAVPAPLQAVVLLAFAPTALMLLLSYQQLRWFAPAATLSLATFVAVTAVLSTPTLPLAWTRGRRVLAAVLAGLILLPFPAYTILGPWRIGYSEGPVAQQLIIRDLAQMLRARSDGGSTIALSAPTVTTWLAYFGGLRGIGTLYWENLDGLKTAARIYAAPSEERAKELIDQHGITHLVVFGSEPFVREYTRLAREHRLEPQSLVSSSNAGFVERALEPATRAAWLAPVPYDVPLKDTSVPVLVLEVVRNK